MADLKHKVCLLPVLTQPLLTSTKCLKVSQLPMVAQVFAMAVRTCSGNSPMTSVFQLETFSDW